MGRYGIMRTGGHREIYKLSGNLNSVAIYLKPDKKFIKL